MTLLPLADGLHDIANRERNLPEHDRDVMYRAAAVVSHVDDLIAAGRELLVGMPARSRQAERWRDVVALVVGVEVTS